MITSGTIFNKSMGYNQGDIVLVSFPFTDLSNAKLRPAVVISNKKLNNIGDDFILAQITTTIRNDNFSIILTDSDLTISIPKRSEIRTNKFFTANESIIQKKISSIKKSKQEELFNKIIEVLEIK